jgi:hypothetical protein
MHGIHGIKIKYLVLEETNAEVVEKIRLLVVPLKYLST